MGVFLDVKVQPVYGKFRALVSWEVTPEWRNGVFKIEKSPDGVNDWQQVGTVPGEQHFVDTNLLSQGKLLEQYYRVSAHQHGQCHTSSTIGTFGTVSRLEFGAARRIMELEYEALRCFTKVHLFKLRASGPSCSVCVYEDTDQAIGTSTCTNCYGTQKDKGYQDPVVTYMRIMTISPTVQNDSTEGTGTTDPSMQMARMLAFPLLRKNDLLVHKEADRRYLVNEVDYSYLGGKIPVIAQANLMLLPTGDIRYRVPLG